VSKVRRLLRLADDRILVEQLRLSMGNLGITLIPTFLIVILICGALYNKANSTAIMVWGVVVTLSKLMCWSHARHHLRSGIVTNKAVQVVLLSMLLNTVDGAIWGSLAWVALDTTSLMGSILVIAVLTAVAGNSMSLLSPVLPIFLALVAAEIAVAVSKVFLLDDPTYNALGLAGLLYIFILMAQAHNSSRAARAAIVLGLENIELMEKLRLETTVAQQARQEAELANTAKSKFLAAASHDLRQPIHAQGLFLDILSRSGLNPEQQQWLDCAVAASQASAEMLNTMLDFSRIEAGVVEPKVVSFRLQPLLNKIEREFARQADAKGLVYRTRETELAADSDPALIELILRNLVSNAIRYTDSGGLLVACHQRGGQVLLEVWDTGIGIEPAHQREVFREFHQLGNPERDRRKGLGLGLSIVEGLARTLGHPLMLNSKRGRGSMFRLTLPLATGVCVDNAVVLAQHHEQLRGVRVLVVDDDEAVRIGTRHLLQDWGCLAEAAESIEEALTLAGKHVPDVVISDYRLRDQRTGLEAIAALRSVLGQSLPALLITGDTAPDRLRDALSSNIPLLHKPVSPDQLHRGLVAALFRSESDISLKSAGYLYLPPSS
jgi:signal transduction histidine kinase/ActR/RegA family two-component response regulator